MAVVSDTALRLGLYIVEFVISLVLIKVLLTWREQEASIGRMLAFTLTWIAILVLADLGTSERVWAGLSVIYGWLLLIVPWFLVEAFFKTCSGVKTGRSARRPEGSPIMPV